MSSKHKSQKVPGTQEKLKKVFRTCIIYKEFFQKMLCNGDLLQKTRVTHRFSGSQAVEICGDLRGTFYALCAKTRVVTEFLACDPWGPSSIKKGPRLKNSIIASISSL